MKNHTIIPKIWLDKKKLCKSPKQPHFVSIFANTRKKSRQKKNLMEENLTGNSCSNISRSFMIYEIIAIRLWTTTNTAAIVMLMPCGCRSHRTRLLVAAKTVRIQVHCTSGMMMMIFEAVAGVIRRRHFDLLLSQWRQSRWQWWRIFCFFFVVFLWRMDI